MTCGWCVVFGGVCVCVSVGVVRLLTFVSRCKNNGVCAVKVYTCVRNASVFFFFF